MPRALWLIIIGMIINVTGSSFLWPLNTIYIHDHLGKSLSVAGLVLMLNAGATVIGNLFGGTLFDKIGGYKSIIAGVAVTLVAIIGLVFYHGWPHYVILLTIVGFGSGIIVPSMFALAGSVWPEGGRKAFNAVYIAQNMGVAIGSALAGFVASYSFDYIFIANAIMYVLFFFLALLGYRGLHAEKAGQSSILEQSKVVKNRSKLNALLILSIGYLLCWVAYVQWQATISSYTQDIGISLKQYSLLWTINGGLIVLAQPVTNLVVKIIAKSLKKQIIIGILIFIFSFIVVSNASSFQGFLVAMVILTIGEMFVWPAVPTIANDLAPKGREGFYQGIVNSTATGGRMIGPLLGGILVDLYGMSVLFTVLALLLVVSIFTTIIYDRKIKHKQEEIVISA
ncbi:MDR family MFS transporter [Ferdinandcohnia quinoae]|uniref:MFS transporter n=1 Tax=Fredinandcohnia quinoae TaxID=2918902 RepID=A0AAW5DYF5_9BACI|nr:MFS transporter [Fredinandcohnia sp. SECRCQ15]MCH1625403.1 MFS transporter [Fredinandcohnia sp. SECRCQ15]